MQTIPPAGMSRAQTMHASALPKRYHPGSEPMLHHATTSNSRSLPHASTFSSLDEPTPARTLTTVLKPPRTDTNRPIQVVSQISPGVSVSMPGRAVSPAPMYAIPMPQVPSQAQNLYPTPSPTSNGTGFSPTLMPTYIQQMTPTSGTFTSPSFSSGLPSPPYTVLTPQSAPAQPFMSAPLGLPSPPPTPQLLMTALPPPPIPLQSAPTPSGTPLSYQTMGLSVPVQTLPYQTYQTTGPSTPSATAPTTTSLPQQPTSQSTPSTHHHSQTSEALKTVGKKVGMFALEKLGKALVSEVVDSL